MNVAVLGAGPSGLLAAWAVIDAGHELTIYEREKRKPDGTTAGVYVLHDDCHLPVRSVTMDVLVSGGRNSIERQDNYEKKVYRTTGRIPVSIPPADDWMQAFDGMQALAFCWDIVHPLIHEYNIHDWTEVLSIANEHDFVVNTIPLNVLLKDEPWKFEKATVYRGEAPADESYMLYQANLRIPWYRASAVFGVFTLEYPGIHQISGTNTPELESKRGKYAHAKKVINTPESMPDVPDNVLLTGRFGAWDKSKLSHHAYYDTMKRLG